MNTRKAMSEAIAVLDAPGSQGVGRTMYLKTRWTKVEEPSRSGRLLSRAGGQDTCKRVYLRSSPCTIEAARRPQFVSTARRAPSEDCSLRSTVCRHQESQGS